LFGPAKVRTSLTVARRKERKGENEMKKKTILLIHPAIMKAGKKRLEVMG